jgi:hypothetical protein
MVVKGSGVYKNDIQNTYKWRLFQNFSFWNSFLPRRKLHKRQMPALQEISHFLQELVSKPTGFWNKLNVLAYLIQYMV